MRLFHGHRVGSLLFIMIIVKILASGCANESVPESPAAKKSSHKIESPASNRDVAPSITNNGKKSQTSRTEQSNHNSSPEFVGTAESIVKEFAERRESASTKYKGKLIEITGEVDEVSQTVHNQFVFDLEIPSQPNGPYGVLCFFDPEKTPWMQARPGQTVRLQGTLDPFQSSAGGVLGFMHCNIIEVTGSPCPELTANQLAEEFDANPMQTGKKYNDKKILLHGEVVKIEVDKSLGLTMKLHLKHNSQCSVICQWPEGGGDKRHEGELKVGMKISAIGTCDSYVREKPTVKLVADVLLY